MSSRNQHKAFGVAKLMNVAVLDDVRKSLVKAQREGLPLDAWKKQITPELKKAGWWGRQDVTNPKTGKTENVLTGSPWRLETIYRTNMATSFQAGRMAQQLQLANRRPYWQYITVGDGRTRPSHSELHGKVVLASNRAFWDAHYPPNGYNCRCRVRAMNEKQLQRDDLKALDPKTDPELKTFKPDRGFGESPLDFDLAKLIEGKAYPSDLKKAYLTAIKEAPKAAPVKTVAPETSPATSELREGLLKRAETLGAAPGEFDFAAQRTYAERGRKMLLEMADEAIDDGSRAAVKYDITQGSQVSFKTKSVKIGGKTYPGEVVDKAKELEEAADFLRRVTRADEALDKVRPRITIDPAIKTAQYRTNNTLMLGTRDSVQTMVHELSHGIELNRSGALQKSLDFLERRSAGRGSVKTSRGQVGRDGGFFSEYCGIVYKEGSRVRATELVAMGVERLYADPVGFARQDADYFEFILDVLGIGERR
jgi:SPP1 gp7 family putative phage head morphogenesis protein